MIQITIGLGSNIDNPGHQLQQGLRALGGLPQSHLLGVSKVYKSAPIGPQDQPYFLNAVAIMNTALDPLGVLDQLQAIETQMGRVKTRHWGERCIDLDLLLYAQKQVKLPRLTLPHPGIAERSFVLHPMMDVLGADFEMPDGQVLGRLATDCPQPWAQATELSLSWC